MTADVLPTMAEQLAGPPTYDGQSVMVFKRRYGLPDYDVPCNSIDFARRAEQVLGVICGPENTTLAEQLSGPPTYDGQMLRFKRTGDDGDLNVPCFDRKFADRLKYILGVHAEPEE